MPGASEEDDYPGHSGIGDDTPEKRLNSTWAQFPPGGLDLAPGLCSAGNLVSQGYADGVSMGGRIEATPSSGSPRFVVMANQDPGTTGFPGTPLSEGEPTEHAFYYVRVLESPTCRWSQRLCLDAGVDCALGVPAGFEACCGGSVPETIQERAISSPIWVRPVPEPNFLVGLWIGGVVLLTKRRTALIRPIGSVARTEGFGPRTPSPICCQEPD